MSKFSLNIDQRVLPLAKTIKEKPIKSNKLLSKIAEDLSSEKTSENTPKMENVETKEGLQKKRNNTKRTKSMNKLKTITNHNKPNNAIRKNIKISIDAEAEHKKSSTSDKYVTKYQNTKIQIVSKSKESMITSSNNLNIFSGGQLTQKKFHNLKTRSKYVQNLLNDMSIKKYTQTCVDLLKNDNSIKKLYEECGFEKTNYNYESFIKNNFFNKPLFMFKLEMLFLDESNFGKKNFKDIFFKNEIVNYLNKYIDENKIKIQMNSLTNAFKEGFENIANLDLLHN
jgi:hypothetical protein